MRSFLTGLLLAAACVPGLAQTRADSLPRERPLSGNILREDATAAPTNILNEREVAPARPVLRPRGASPDAAPEQHAIPPRPTSATARPRRLPPPPPQTIEPPETGEAEEATAQQTLAQGWERLNAGAAAEAVSLFESVLADFPDQATEAHHGLALLALQARRLSDAARHADAMPPDHPERAALRAHIALASGWEALDAGRLEAAQVHFQASLDLGPADAASARHGLGLIALRQERHAQALHLAEQLPADFADRAALLRSARLGLAWRQLASSDPASFDAFADLYRAGPDDESAGGLVNAARRFDRLAEIAALSTKEPLTARYRQTMAEVAFADKRFQLARTLDRKRFADIGIGGTPFVVLSAAQRDKKTPALHMRIEWSPSIAAGWPDSHGDTWSFHAEHVRIAAKEKNTGEIYAASGPQARLQWRREERDATWETALGSTPDLGKLEPSAEVLLARTWHGKEQRWRLSAYRQAVKDSVISYVGIRDPITGARFGGVLAAGIQGEWRTALGERWSASLSARAEKLGGKQVANNRRDYWETGIGYDLRPPGFDHAVLSLNYSEDRFEKNLGQETIGHGHYFSPQKYTRRGPALDFMTEERRPFMVKGRLSFGHIHKHEAHTWQNPIAENGELVAGANDKGSAREYEIGASWLVAPSIQLGGWATYRRSPEYRDSAFMLFVNLLFEPRRGILSTDLPNAHAARLY